MDDTKLLLLLSRKMAKELSAAEAKELDELLARNPEALYKMELLTHLWQQQPLEGDTDISYSRHRERFSNEFEPSFEAYGAGPYSGKTRKRWLAPAAAVSLLAIIAAVFMAWPGSHGRETMPGKHPQEIVALKGKRKAVILPDSTKVWLNGDSRLSYDNDMNTKATRTVYLDGEAYFDVVKKERQPFIVQTRKIAIRVLGTAFNIKAYKEDRVTETSLFRGMVELSVNDKPEKKIVLKPNEKFVLVDNIQARPQSVSTHAGNTDTSRKLIVTDIVPVTVSGREYVEESSWVENRLVFKNENMEDLLPRLERWYNVKIDLQNDAIKTYHYTGVLQHESIQEALDYMQMIRPFRYKINNDSIIIF